MFIKSEDDYVWEQILYLYREFISNIKVQNHVNQMLKLTHALFIFTNKLRDYFQL